MVMPAINSRDDLLAWLRRRVVYRSIRRQIDNGDVEVMGGFTAVPPHFHPGWIVTFIVEGSTIMVFSVSSKGAVNKINAEDILWEHWCGEGRTNTAYRGDDPEWCKKLKEKNNGLNRNKT